MLAHSNRRYWDLPPVLGVLMVLGCFAGLLSGSPNALYGRIPLTFIENYGQASAAVRFMSKGPGMTAYFTSSEIVLGLQSSVVRLRYPDAKQTPEVSGLDRQEGHANYLIGSDPSKWRTDIPMYGQVLYHEIYPGIDMIYSAQTRWLKSEFVVAPGADSSRIRIEYTGVDALYTDPQGRLIIVTRGGELCEEPPEIYQTRNGSRIPVQGSFRVLGHMISFDLGPYDHSLELVIDPILSYSTYLGGSGTDRGNAIAVDSSGAAYVTGYTDSTDLPATSGVLQNTSHGGVDVFVAKLNTSGTAIAYLTYLGGTGDDRGYSIAVDASGSAYVTGWTGSPNFPVASAAQWLLAGARNAFVCKLNAGGTALVYSTYLGGSGSDSGYGIAVDNTTAAYVTGSTSSRNFPTTPGPLQPSLAGTANAFITKLSASGGAIVYSTYLGGSSSDQGSSIAIDSTGAAYIAGVTYSTNFPTVSALQQNSGGAPDAFVAKVSASGAALIYSTYLGGAGMETIANGSSIAVDASGSAYVAGTTFSSNFPTLQPMQADLNGFSDAFVVKLNQTGTALIYGTFLGGSSVDVGQAIAVDGSGNTYVAGYTSSTDFPIINGDQPVNGGGYDAFVVKLNPAGSLIVESNLLGGSGNDAAYGIAIDVSGSAYVTGQTLSANFPLKNAIQTSLGSTLAAFVAKWTFGGTTAPAAVSVSPISGSGGKQTFTLVYSDGRGISDLSWVEVEWNASQSNAGACYVHYIPSSNAIELSNDAGTGWLGPVTLGTAGTLQNSQCVLDGGSSSFSASGTNLTLSVALTFLPSFAGAKNVYMQIQSAAVGLTAWQSRGTWNASAVAPTNVSVTPSSGSGINQIFSFTYTDPYGPPDVSWVQMHFQTQLVAQSACYLQYTRSTNTIVLINDAGTGSVGSALLGSAGILSNSQCALNAAASSFASSGNNLTVNLALSFMAAFAGTKNASMGVINNANAFSGWQQMGSWTIPVGGTLPPANVSVSPSSGSGSSQTFSFVYSDPYGNADLGTVMMHFQTQLVAANACYLQYTVSTATIQLISDAGTGPVGPGQTLGSPGTLVNSQCTLNLASSSASGSLDNLTINLALSFATSFQGPKNISLNGVNASGVPAGWKPMGSWTVTRPGNLPPANVSVSPASGTGLSQTFVSTYSDPYGNTDLSWVEIHFQAQLTAQNACYLQYTRSTNAIQLINDAGSGNVGSGGTLGSVGSLANSQCTLNLASSSVSASGNNLTVTLSITFSGTFTGTKNISMGAVNNATIFSGWQQMGTWTPQ